MALEVGIWDELLSKKLKKKERRAAKAYSQKFLESMISGRIR